MTATRPRLGLTGASGFLGRAIARSFTAAGIEAASLGRGDARPWRAEWTAEEMRPALEGLDVVVHAAARVPRDMRDPAEAEPCLRINALGTLALAQAARDTGVRRFVLVSTASFIERRPAPVADDALPGRFPLAAPYYLTSKLVAETYVQAVAGSDMQVLIVRPSAVYGPGMASGVVSLIVGRFREGQPVVLHDGGRHAADYVFVDDVAQLIATATQSDLVGHVNAGSGVASDLRDLAAAVRDAVPDSPATVTLGPVEPERPPSGFPALDISRARDALGYRPRSLRQGIRDLLQAAG